jgi:ATP-dependent protease ClpP protease subunit
MQALLVYILCAGYAQLHGDITSLSVERAQNELAHTSWLHINTNGGDAIAGIEFMKYLLRRNDVRCVVDDHANSMGFAILQACHTRYVRPTATLYQHELQVAVNGRLSDVQKWVSFAVAHQKWLTNIQSARIGIPSDELHERFTANGGWLLNSTDAIRFNCADHIWELIPSSS